MNVALVHDYLVQHGGAERVVEALLEVFPDAPLYTSIYDRHAFRGSLARADVRTSFLQRIPLPAGKRQRYLLPLYPLAFRRFDLSGFDLVISSASSFAKAVSPAPAARHLCYCHAPTRFLWDYDSYARGEGFSRLVRAGLAPLVWGLRRLDVAAAKRVTRFIANSRETARRIGTIYGRSADVIHPPVDLSDLSISGKGEGEFFLIVSRLVPAKRIDLAVAAFNALRRPLVVVGDGRHRRFLEAQAGPTVRFLGWVSRERLIECYARCSALVLPGQEDFGIAAVEAQACGKPVIAYAAGGALETVREGETGVLFTAQSLAEVAEAVEAASRRKFDPSAIRAHALRFDKEIFKSRIRALATSARAASGGGEDVA
jgi:glycosyltransferase involved in cell wall biosynthesis